MDLQAYVFCFALILLEVIEAGFVRNGNVFRERRGVRLDFHKLPNPIVYYNLDSTLDDQRLLRECISTALKLVANNTCIQFENTGNRNPPTNYRFIFINHNLNSYCTASTDLKTNVPSFINLGDDCGSDLKICTRLLLNAMGLEFEHERPDRDAYIKVHLSKVKGGDELLFTKILDLDTLTTPTPYDISSIMHFGSTEFSKANERTIEARDPIMSESVGSAIRGDANLLSHRDLYTLNQLFRCSEHCPKQIQCKHGGFMDKNCRCVCTYGFTGEDCSYLSKSQNFNVFKQENKQSECGFIHANGSGYITSPKFPNRYPRGAFCQWMIQAPHPWQRIEFKFEKLDLEHEGVIPASRCNDRLTVWPHGTDVVTPIISCFPEDIKELTTQVHRTQYNWLLIEFQSWPWGETDHSGFNISYRLVGEDPDKQRVSRNDAVVLDENKFPIREVIKNMSYRLLCFACVGPKCNQTLSRLPTVECDQMEACGLVTDDDEAVMWRGCLDGDKCITDSGTDCRLNHSDDPICGSCCAHHFCNSALTSAPSVLFPLIFLIARLL